MDMFEASCRELTCEDSSEARLLSPQHVYCLQQCLPKADVKGAFSNAAVLGDERTYAAPLCEEQTWQVLDGRRVGLS